MSEEFTFTDKVEAWKFYFLARDCDDVDTYPPKMVEEYCRTTWVVKIDLKHWMSQ